MMTRTEKGYYTKEAAKLYTSLSQRTLEYAVSRGKLRAFKVGKRVLFAKEDLDRFIRQREAGADIDRIVDEAVRDVLGA
jgi:excisionase family DNA binding protein